MKKSTRRNVILIFVHFFIDVILLLLFYYSVSNQIQRFFVNYLNSQHTYIKFTTDEKIHSELNFLALTVHRSNKFFTPTVYCKPTFTVSFCPKHLKIDSVNILIHRAYNICCFHNYLHSEFKFLEFFSTLMDFQLLSFKIVFVHFYRKYSIQ